MNHSSWWSGPIQTSGPRKVIIFAVINDHETDFYIVANVFSHQWSFVVQGPKLYRIMATEEALISRMKFILAFELFRGIC